MTEPLHFHIHRLIISRDHKIIATVSLFVEALSGRAILDNVGSAGPLGVGIPMRSIIALWWFFAQRRRYLVVKSLGGVFPVAVDERTDTPEMNSDGLTDIIWGTL